MYLILLHFVIGIIVVKSLARRLGLQSLTGDDRFFVVLLCLLFWEIGVAFGALWYVLSKIADFCAIPWK
jgi:hypothetical protein